MPTSLNGSTAPDPTRALSLLLATVPALRQMKRRELKVLKREPFSLCLEQIANALDDDEQTQSVTSAVSASRGRGVLVLTDRRLILITMRSGICDWQLSGIDNVRGRVASFTMPAAIFLDTPTGTSVIVVGDGPVWGPIFTEAVRRSHARQPVAKAA
jgi:hypothetical protein